MKFLVSILFIFGVFISQAQLKLSEIMGGNDFIGHQPEQITWAPDNNTVYFRWNHDNELVSPYYETTISKKSPLKLENSETIYKTTRGFYSDSEHEHIYFQKNGNLYQWGQKESKLILQKSTYFSIVSVLDNNRIILNENNNLYLFDPNNGKYIQLIDFKKS